MIFIHCLATNLVGFLIGIIMDIKGEKITKKYFVYADVMLIQKVTKER